MSRGTAQATVTIRGLPRRAWVRGTFASGRHREDAGPVRTDPGGSATLEAKIDAAASLTFTVSTVSEDRDGRRTYIRTGEPSATIVIAPRTVPASAKLFFGGKPKKGLPPKRKGVLYVRLADRQGRPVVGARIVAEYRKAAARGEPLERTWKKTPAPDTRDCPDGTYAVRPGHSTYQLRLVAVVLGAERYELERPASAWVCAAPRQFKPYGDLRERLSTNSWNKRYALVASS